MECHLSNRQPGQLSNKPADWAWVAETKIKAREGDGWAPAQTSHTEMVMLDGAPICVSWLEEEALAYIRCGRLERAALCLPHCDYSRLFAFSGCRYNIQASPC
jgi:hypothetical protein